MDKKKHIHKQNLLNFGLDTPVMGAPPGINELNLVQHKHSIQAHNQNLNKGIHRSTKPPLTWTCKCPKPRNAKSNQRHLTAARSNSPHSANAGKRAQKLRNNSRKLRNHTTSARARRAKKKKTKIKSCISGYKPEPTTRETLRKQFIKVSRIKKKEQLITRISKSQGHESVLEGHREEKSVSITQKIPKFLLVRNTIKNLRKDTPLGAAQTSKNQDWILEPTYNKFKVDFGHTSYKKVSFKNENNKTKETPYHKKANLGQKMKNKKWETNPPGKVPEQIFENTEVGPQDVVVTQESTPDNPLLESEMISGSSQGAEETRPRVEQTNSSREPELKDPEIDNENSTGDPKKLEIAAKVHK